MTPEQRIDEALISVLKASGKTHDDYTQGQIDSMRSAMRKIVSDAYIQGYDRAYKSTRERCGKWSRQR